MNSESLRRSGSRALVTATKLTAGSSSRLVFFAVIMKLQMAPLMPLRLHVVRRPNRVFTEGHNRPSHFISDMTRHTHEIDTRS